MVNSGPISVPSVEKSPWVTPATPAIIAARHTIRVRVRAGSMPQSSAPTSFSMIERMHLPSSVSFKKANRPAKIASAMAEAARLAVRIGMPATSTIGTGRRRLSENSGNW